MIKSLKRFVYGWCPYVFTKTFAPASPKLEYYKFFKEHPYTHHPYDFAAQYLDMDVVVSRDTVKGLPYVLHGGRRLYFPAAFSDRQVSVAYKCLMLEQDVRHPHHYVDSMEELRGMTLCDVGASEGFTSLEAIDYVRHIYLFEYDPAWIEALEATFEPWRDKVTLVKKFVGDADDDKNVRLDTFFKDQIYRKTIHQNGYRRRRMHGIVRCRTPVPQCGRAGIRRMHLPSQKRPERHIGIFGQLRLPLFPQR